MNVVHRFLFRAHWWMLAAAILLAGCSDNPVDSGVVCDHIDVDGLVVEQAESFRAGQWQGAVTGGFVLTEGSTVDNWLLTWLDADSTRITVPSECTDHSLRFTVLDSTIVGASVAAGTRWTIRLVGKTPGTTTIRFRLWHGDHADFTSLEFPVTVEAGVVPRAVWVRNGCSVAATWNYNPDRGANTATGPLITAPGSVLEGLMVEWLGPWDPGDGGNESGHRSTLDVPSGLYELGLEIGNEEIARVESVDGQPWTFNLVGIAEGATTLTLRFLAEGRIIYESGSIPVRVMSGAGYEAAPDFYIKKNGITNVIVQNETLVPSACNRNANPGRLEVGLNELSDLFFLKLLNEACNTVDPSSTRDTLVFDFENGCLVEVTQHPIHWGERNFFHFFGREAGDTTVGITFLHDGVPKWVSPPIPVRVHA